jgi:hypothetical protein
MPAMLSLSSRDVVLLTMAEATQQVSSSGRPLSGLLRTPDDVLTALRARQNELGLSNEALEHAAGFCGGTVNKYLGPAREKCPTLPTLYSCWQRWALAWWS